MGRPVVSMTRVFIHLVKLFVPPDVARVPGEAGVRHAADQDYKVHGERHLHALQLWSQPARGVPTAQALQDGVGGGGDQQGGRISTLVV